MQRNLLFGLFAILTLSACGEAEQNSSDISDNTDLITSNADLIDANAGAVADNGASIDSNASDIAALLTAMDAQAARLDALEGAPVMASQSGRSDVSVQVLKEASYIEDTAWRDLGDYANAVELTTAGGDVVVQMYFPVVMREAKVHFGVTLDGRAEGPVKGCGTISAREVDTVEYRNVACTFIFPGLEPGVHTFAPSILIDEADYVEAYFGVRYAMTAFEVQ